MRTPTPTGNGAFASAAGPAPEREAVGNRLRLDRGARGTPCRPRGQRHDERGDAHGADHEDEQVEVEPWLRLGGAGHPSREERRRGRGGDHSDDSAADPDHGGAAETEREPPTPAHAQRRQHPGIALLREHHARQELAEYQRAGDGREQGKDPERDRLRVHRPVHARGQVALHDEAVGCAEPVERPEEAVEVATAVLEAHHQLVGALREVREVVLYRVQRRGRVDQVPAGALDLRRELAGRCFDADDRQPVVRDARDAPVCGRPTPPPPRRGSDREVARPARSDRALGGGPRRAGGIGRRG